MHTAEQASRDLPNSLPPFARAASIDTTMAYMGSLVSFLARGSDTAGRFALVQFHGRPGSEPPPHYHEWEDELYFVLDGAMEVHCAEATFRVAAGEVGFVPSGQAHAFYILSTQLTVLVLAQSVDGRPVGLDRYFVEMAEPATTMALPSAATTHILADPERAISIARKHGTHILSPDQVSQKLPNYPGFGAQPVP